MRIWWYIFSAHWILLLLQHAAAVLGSQNLHYKNCHCISSSSGLMYGLVICYYAFPSSHMVILFMISIHDDDGARERILSKHIILCSIKERMFLWTERWNIKFHLYASSLPAVIILPIVSFIVCLLIKITCNQIQWKNGSFVLGILLDNVACVLGIA